MTVKEFWYQKGDSKDNDEGSFEEFISEFEDKWLQYADEESKVKAYFGTVENGMKTFNKWKSGLVLFEEEKSKAFPQPLRFT